MSSLLLNLGSGQRPFSYPWINIDCQEKWNPDIIDNVITLDRIYTGSVDIIVAHHVLEHFVLEDGIRALKRWHEVLKDEGSLIITIPNIKVLAMYWLTNRIDDYTFFVNCMGAYMGSDYDTHKWHYTEDSLKSELEKIGFKKVTIFNFRKLEGADIAKDWWILGMEAIK